MSVIYNHTEEKFTLQAILLTETPGSSALMVLYNVNRSTNSLYTKPVITVNCTVYSNIKLSYSLYRDRQKE